MAEPGYPIHNPPPIGLMPGHPGITTPPPTNRPNPYHQYGVGGPPDNDTDAPGVPDMDTNYAGQRALPLQPFQPNWFIGHPLPWNSFRQDSDHDIDQSPFILGIGREG